MNRIEEENGAPVKINNNRQLTNRNQKGLSKKQLCERIVKNMMVKYNILAAILTVLPQEKDGKLHGFCMDRYTSLVEGRYCLPPDFGRSLRGLKIDALVPKLTKYMDNMRDNFCKKKGGLIKKLSESERKALFANINEKYNKYYIQHLNDLRKDYISQITELVGILKTLDEAVLIPNKQLNEIATRVKELVNEVYATCHRNYLYSLIALVHAEYEVINQSENVENIF